VLIRKDGCIRADVLVGCFSHTLTMIDDVLACVLGKVASFLRIVSVIVLMCGLMCCCAWRATMHMLLYFCYADV